MILTGISDAITSLSDSSMDPIWNEKLKHSFSLINLQIEMIRGWFLCFSMTFRTNLKDLFARE